ncbi:MAG: bifunctional transaldolase/phosoglucose isomerase [Thermodesulfobacteriota bacterium]
MNPLKELSEFGQSVWYDNIRRSLITSGELDRMIRDYGLSGMTSNPVIFEKAISGAEEYDPDIERLMGEGKTGEEILTTLTTDDIRLAARALLPVFERTGGADGYVSIEVNPGLAHDAEGSIAEAHHLRDIVDMPNVMIKIPGTEAGLRAVEELVYEGFNINVTLLFSVKRYEEVAWAYVGALERRAKESKPLDGIFSVASFFVSRVDTLVDGLLDERAAKAGSNDEKARLHALEGRVAVAGAKLAYVRHGRVFSSDRFADLRAAGARPQRLLWASTSTKNPRYSDIKYVEELIAPDTVNTMPLATLHAFEDHGQVSATLEQGLDEADWVVRELEDLGVSYDDVTATLEREGIKGFEDGFAQLLAGIEEKAGALRAGGAEAMEMDLGDLADAADEAVGRLDAENFIERLWEKDPTLWKKTPGDRELIKNALGWLALPQTMSANVEAIKAFAAEVKGELFTDAVLLGMGGSSLAPLVLAETLGPVKGYPRLTVLDSTDPDAVREVAGRIKLRNTLFIVSSKSGSTIEPLSLFEYFYHLLKAEVGDDAGQGFIAITDPGTPLEGFSRKYGFRRLFTNPPDIGGRFSALSCFGLVPAAVAGVDISRLLYHAACVEEAAVPGTRAADDPAVRLGAVLGALGRSGRDKLTFFLSPELAAFGIWIEQLIAESTGKEGKGLVPITGEPMGAPGDYGDDRVFIYICSGGPDPEVAAGLDGLREAGHPVIRLTVGDLHELGGEFLRWEIATAAAGAVLGINPFDQPDVEVAKRLTLGLLDRAGGEGGEEAGAGAPVPPGAAIEGDGMTLSIGPAAAERLKGGAAMRDGDVTGAMGEFLSLAGPGGYVGVLAYVNPFDRSLDPHLTEIRRALRDATGAAVQFGYGPRYLHSTGQIHKGGPKTGVFLMITHDTASEIEIPESRFGFSTLELSQGFGDMEALDSKGLPVALLHLTEATSSTLSGAEGVIKEALAKTRIKG